MSNNIKKTKRVKRKIIEKVFIVFYTQSMIYSKMRRDKKRCLFFFYGGKMKKIITIDGKEYNMKSSAYTQFSYKNLTGRSLLKDLQKLINLKESGKLEEDMSVADDVIELLLDVAYVMIDEADKTQFTNKEEFYKSIDTLYGEDMSWINEVLSLAINPLSRQLQNS